MTENNRILQRAIQKAVDNGFKIGVSMEEVNKILDNNRNVSPAVYYWIIFDHAFAKAFFKDTYGMGGKTDFKCHLQKMIVLINPLKYLERYL